MKNLADVISWIENLRQEPTTRNYKRQKPKEYLFFLDLKKAFDTIDRGMLIQKMINKGFNSKIITATRVFYQNMTLKVKDEEILTNIGVV